jgi:predicted acylesterase/phospholipase RssA
MNANLGRRRHAPPAGAAATTLINGVFKGGGAKGLVYVGALKAVRERGFRFTSVAGSSAGAITATLIAANLSCEEIERAADEGLRVVRGGFPFGLGQLLLGLFPLTSKSIFSVRRLERWLEGLLCHHVRGESANNAKGPMTFEELHRATEIELYVVALDLARRQPIVFHRRTTPSCSVAQAVLASCAIPVAMPAGRVTVREPDGSERVHRLVDGGAWANYPSFVFRDSSFRKFHTLQDVPVNPLTIGFIIDDVLPPPDKRPRILRMEHRRRDAFDLGSGAGAGLLGALLNWPPLQYAATVAFPLVLGFVLFDWFRLQAARLFPVVTPLPDRLEPVAVLSLLAGGAVFFSLSTVIAMVLYRFGREASDVGLPALFASLSVGPSVPDWVGDDATADPVIRLSPPKGIRTTTFAVDRQTLDAAIRTAYGETARQFDALYPDRKPAASPVASPESEEEELAEVLAPPGSRYGAFVLIGLLAAATVISYLLGALAGGRFFLALGLALTSTTILLLLAVHGAQRYASRLALLPSLGSPLRSTARIAVVVTLMIGLYYAEARTGSLYRLLENRLIGATILKKHALSLGTKFYDVQLDEVISDVKFGGVGSAYWHCESSPGPSCFAFQTTSSFKAGDRTNVVVMHGTNEVFFEVDLWTRVVPKFLITFALYLAFATYLAWSIDDLRRHWRARFPKTSNR